jgi:hypothetical protein
MALRLFGLLKKHTQDISAMPMDASMHHNIDLRLPEYQPIAERDSRLLRLSPGQWEDPIAFDFVDFSTELGRLPFYEAISYTWGNSTECTPVFCSGREIDVSLSVAALLRRFRLCDSTRYASEALHTYKEFVNS